MVEGYHCLTEAQRQSPLQVSLRKARNEHMFSGLSRNRTFAPLWVQSAAQTRT